MLTINSWRIANDKLLGGIVISEVSLAETIVAISLNYDDE
jgi:hypothetical protein